MSPNDQEIVKRVVAGEKKAFAQLVERHKDQAMTLAMRMLKNREESEEAVQDAFLRAFNALPGFEWRSSFSTWFYRIVYNVCSTQLTRRSGRHPVQDDVHPVAEELRDPNPTPDMDVESSEFQQIVREEVENLPPAYSSVVTLFFLQEMSYAEIVDVTGMPLGTVKAKLFRARAILKEAMVRRMAESTPVPGLRGIAAAFF